MKFYKFPIIAAVALSASMVACDDDDLGPGNPVMQVVSSPSDVHFGDSLEFTINASDASVPLSTIHATLYFGDEPVEETVIRTKESGKDYTGKIYIPYFANVPDGKARLHLSLQNISFTMVEEDREISITHAQYPYLTLVTKGENGEETYRMERTDGDTYAVKAKFPQKLPAKIIAPATGTYGNEITFGYASGAVTINGTNDIPFSNSKAGKYEVTFNTRTFEGAPFVVMKLGNDEFITDDNNADLAVLDINLTQGQPMVFSGIPSFEQWWIDPDFIKVAADGSMTWAPISGSYRIIADQANKYFRIYSITGSNPTVLSDDGSGALWVIGNSVGKPKVSTNEVGWTTENALCMAPVADKVYQITFIGGKTVKTDGIDFKFFGQMGWGVELKGTVNYVEVPSALVGVGQGKDVNGHDDGNLYLLDGVTLQQDMRYVFTVDLTGGLNAAKFSVKEDGIDDTPVIEVPVLVNDTKIADSGTAMDLTQGMDISVSGTEIEYADPDYFTGEDGEYTFNAVNGKYLVIISKGILSAKALNSDGTSGTYEGDSKAIWLMGWGVSSPSNSSQFGWDPGKAYSVAQIAPGKYQFSGFAGPEKGSAIGDRFRTDYLSFKFFGQDGWGFEFSDANALTLTEGAKAFLKADGNFLLADGVSLEQGAFYVLTIDTNAMTLDMVKK